METRQPSRELLARPMHGLPMLFLALACPVLAIASFVSAVRSQQPTMAVVGVVLILAMILILPGLFVVNPNQARVLTLFGNYRGTVQTQGFHWVNPFSIKSSISLRANTLNGDKLKVNDLLGNPIEIAAVIVWQVRNTAQAKFDVEKHESFVAIQSESAVRLVASRHPYDDGQTHETTTTLRGSADVIAQELRTELQQRLDLAGVQVVEARLSHLAYAPEIAAAMLQRQQAAAVIAARQMIVEGAVGMVDMALARLAEKKVLQLDDERRATLAGNLLVVLCGHVAPAPVVNTGSLYN